MALLRRPRRRRSGPPAGVSTPAQIFGSALQFWGRADLGLTTNGAALLTTASSQYFSLASALVTGYPFTVSMWVKLTNLSQYNGLWAFQVSSGNQIYVTVGTGGNVIVYFGGNALTTSSVMTAGTTYNVLITYDGTTCNIYFNGAKDANSGALNNSYGTLNSTYIGALSPGPSQPASATVGPFQVWSRVLGSGEIATVAAGVLYRGFTSSLQNGNVCSIEFTKPGNLGFDYSPNNNTFTPQNAPTYVAGPVSYAPPAGTYLLAGEAVAQGLDYSGNSNTWSQTTGASRYTQSLAAINGLPALQSPGSTPYYSLASLITLSGTFGFYMVGYRPTSTRYYGLGYTVASGNDNVGMIYATNTVFGPDGTTNIAYTGNAGYIATRFRRDSSNRCYAATSGMAEAEIGVISGNVNLNNFLGRVDYGQYMPAGNQAVEAFLANVDPIASGQDAAARSWLNSRYALTIP